ncbi:MAG TPA: 50S ribosomal protein L4 [Candidatus Nanoarchaeia archaeon]|nr:50S ribosomal protein L4 [Candidatus Nanoarchaeia archaeon]
MKTKLYAIDGKKGKEITLPSFFSETVRKNLIQKIIEAKKTQQPYSPNPVAGQQYSASGKLKHHRKVWKSQYGRGISRIPRKIMTRKGSQFHWVGATSPNTRGGRRAHPPKIISLFGLPRINKKEMKLAMKSALSATVSPEWVSKRYASLEGIKIDNLPLIVESKIVELKTKDLLSTLKKILGENLFDLAIRQKTIRSGRGKLRGRKYKSNLGVLLVVGNDEKLKTTAFDVKTVKALGINDLANGAPGRLTIYTEKAIKDLEEKIK